MTKLVRTPKFTLSIRGADITENIKSYALRIEITDTAESKGDEIQVELHDFDRRWQNDWYPKKGDTITCSLGYENEAMSPVMRFEIDELEWQGSAEDGDRINLKGTAVPVNKALRTKKTEAYEKTNLKAIAQKIAGRNGLQLVGEVKEIKFDRQTQKDATDLEYLTELAAKYGQTVKVEGTNKLVFYDNEKLNSAGAVLSIDRTEISDWRVTSKSAEKYKDAKVSYTDPRTGKTHSHTEKAESPKGKFEGADEGITQNTLKIKESVENEAQAREVAKEKLRKANADEVTLEFKTSGDIRLSAGINVNVTGLGRNSGKYHLKEVRHSLDRNGGFVSNVSAEKR